MILAGTKQEDQLSAPSAEAPLLVDLQHLSVSVSATRQTYPLGNIEVARWLRILSDRPNI